MRTCPLLLLLLLGCAAVASGASIRSQRSAARSQQSSQHCVINRRRITEAARRFYEARYETKLLLYKIRIHRQQLEEKRLRYLNFLQRIRLKHHARVQRQALQFQRQVNKAKVAYRKKLRSVTKRYQRRVMRKLKTKPLSNRRIRLIMKAFFRSGIISRRAAVIARRPVYPRHTRRRHTRRRHTRRRHTRRRHTRRRHTRRRHTRRRHTRRRHTQRRHTQRRHTHRRRTRRRQTRRRHTRRRHTRRRHTRRRHTGRRSETLKMPKMLSLHRRRSVAENVKRFDHMRHKFDRALKRALNLHMRRNKLRFRRRILKQRIANFAHRRQLLQTRIAAVKLKRQTLLRRLAFYRTRGPAATGLAVHASVKISECNSRIRDLQKRRHRLKHRMALAAARRKRLRSRINVLKERMKRQLLDNKRLFIHGIKYASRWQAADPEIIHKRAQKNAAAMSLAKNNPTQQHASVLITLTPSKIRRIMKFVRQSHRNALSYLRKTLIYRSRMSRIKRKWKRAKQLVAKFGRSQGQRATALLDQRRLEQELGLLRSKESRVQAHFASNLGEWTKYLITIGLSDFVKDLSSASRAGKKVKRRRMQRKLRQIRHQRNAVRQQKLVHKLSAALGVSQKQLSRIIKKALARKQIRKRRAQLKKFAKRVSKRVIRFQRRLKRTAKMTAIIARRKYHIRSLGVQLKRRAGRIRARRNRLQRRIWALEIRRRRWILKAKQLAATKLAIKRQLSSGQARPVWTAQLVRRLADIRRTMRLTVHKIALCNSRIVTLKRRRVQLKQRIRKIRRRRQRLDKRLVTAKRRVKQKLKLIKKLAKRKRHLVKRVVKHRLVSPRVLRRALKPTQRVIGRILSRRVVTKLTRRDAAKRKSNLPKPVTARTPKIPFPKAKQYFAKLRSKKTVGKRTTRFAKMGHRFVSDIKRTLEFHLRINQLKNSKKGLNSRIRYLLTRKLALQSRVKTVQRKRRELIRRLSVLRHQGPISGRGYGSSSAAPSSIRQSAWSLSRRISKYSRRIRSLRTRRRSLKHRIQRVTLRRQRNRRQISVLRKRMGEQLRESRRLAFRAIKILTRWKAADPKVFLTFGKDNYVRSVGGRVEQLGAPATVLKSLTTSKIRELIRNVWRTYGPVINDFKKSMHLHRRLSEISKSISRMKHEIRTYRRLLEIKHHNSKENIRQRIVIKKIQIRQTTLRHLENRRKVLRLKIFQVNKILAIHIQNWKLSIIRTGLPEFFQFVRKSFRVGSKVNRQIIKRKVRKLRFKKLLAKQRKLVRKLSRSIVQSERRLQRIRLKFTQNNGLLRKRFAKRVARRVKSLQQKLKRAAKNAARVARRKVSFRRRRTELTGRIPRLTERRQRLLRRIRAVEGKRNSLIRRVRQLTATRLAHSHMARSVAHTVSQIRSATHNISVCQARIAALQRRRAMLKLRIHRIRHRQRRLDRRLAAVKRRIKRQAERLKDIVKRKRKFVVRVVRKKLVSHRIIRRISRPSRRVIRRYVGRNLRRKIVQIKRFQKPGRHSNSGTSLKKLLRKNCDRKFGNLHTKKDPISIASKVLSDVARISSANLRPKQSVSKNMKRIANLRHRFARGIERTLYLHLRNNRLSRRRSLLKQRIKSLVGRKQILNRRIIELQESHYQLTRQRKILRRQQSSSGDYGKPRFRNAFGQLERRISTCAKQIRIQRMQRFRLDRRLARTTARRQRTWRRITRLRQRIQRELRDIRRLTVSSTRQLTRWRAIYPVVVGQVASINESADSLRKMQHQKASALKSLTRSKIKRIATFLRRSYKVSERDLQKIMVTNGNMKRARKAMTNTQRQIVVLQKKLIFVRLQLQYKRQGKLQNLQSIPKLKASVGSLRSRIESKEKKLVIQKAKLVALNRKLSDQKRSCIMHLQKWTWYLKTLGLVDFVPVLKKARKASSKIKRKLKGRKLRRVRLQKEVARQQKVIRQLSLRIRKSKRKLRSIKKSVTRTYRAQKKRFTKRVTKRVARLQRKLKRTAKKAAIVARRKQHLARRRISLQRRARRVRAQSRRIKRRIRAAEVRRRRLITRVRQLTARKQAHLRHLSNGFQGRSRVRTSIADYDIRISRALKQASTLGLRVQALKRRRAQSRLRIHKIQHRLRRLESRMAASRQRIKRQIKRIQALVKRKRRFVKRVVKKRLVSRQTVRKISKQSRRVISQYGGRGILKKIGKIIHIQETHSRILGGRQLFMRIPHNLKHARQGRSEERFALGEKRSVKRISISGIRIALPRPAARTRHVSGIRSSVALLSRKRRQLQRNKAKVARLLNVRRLPAVTRAILSHASRSEVTRSDVSKVSQVLGGSKLLKVTNAELVAKQALRSSRPVPVRSLVALQSSLRQKLHSLQRNLATAASAFKSVVQRTKTEFASDEAEVRTNLTDRIVRTQEAVTEVVREQRWQHRTEYRTLVSTERDGEKVSGQSMTTTVVSTEEIAPA